MDYFKLFKYDMFMYVCLFSSNKLRYFSEMSFLTAGEAGLCKLSEAISARVNLTHWLNSWVKYWAGEGGREGDWGVEQETGRPEDETLVLHGIVDRATYMIKFSSNF